ncbi:MAG: SDR family NAD(P)-dependent oxidoreductase [Candidatus Geothermincolia bacterium]
MKVTVTGGAGFIGSNLTDALLERGHNVVVVDNLSTGRFENLLNVKDAAREKRFAFFHMDIRDPAVAVAIKEQEVDAVIHLAAQMDVRNSVADPVNDAEINIIGTINLLRLCTQAGVKKFINTSSGGCIYGEPETFPVKEDAPKWATSPYGVSKNAADLYIRYFSQAYGMDFTTLALANVYGPRQNPFGEAGVVAIFGGKMLAAETPLIFGNGDQTRDFVYVGDVVDAYIRALESGSGELINIGTCQETSVNELYRLIQELTAFEEPPEYMPERAGELFRTCLAIGKAEKVLGWTPSTSMRQGLEKTLDWLRTC